MNNRHFKSETIFYFSIYVVNTHTHTHIHTHVHAHTHIHESHSALGICFSFPTLLKEKTEAMHPVVNSAGNRNRVSKSPVLSSHALAPVSLPEASE